MGLVNFILKLMISSGKKVAADVEAITRRPEQEQEKLLMDTIFIAKDSEFGREHGFAEIKSIDDFKKSVPLTDYDYYSERISRMMNGEKNILTSLDTVHFNVTSGTLGVPKKIPVTELHVTSFSRINAQYLNYIAAKEIGTQWTGGKGLSLSEGTYEMLPCGISMGCASSLHTARMGKTVPFFKSFNSSDLMYTSPKEARQPAALGTYSRYLHALFALREENITYGNVTFSSIFLELMRFIEMNWQSFCDDIEKGTISESVDMPEEERAAALKKLSPMPKRARQLREIFTNHLGEPFGRLIWPKLRFVMMVGGAGFQSYTDKLLDRYLSRNVHVLYFGLSSSEGMYSVPVKMDCPDAVFLPNATFMEFIPVENGETDETQETKLLHQLEIGKQYELVITNVSGLYRYKLHDVIEVTGFYNQTPMMRFVNRSGYAINICAEKSSEAAIRFAAEKTSREMGRSLYDYCVSPVQDEKGSRYIFMYEFMEELPIDRKALRDATEKNLIEANPDYDEELKAGNLQPTEAIVLQQQTFMLYRDLMILKGRSAAQLKPIHVAITPYQQRFFAKLEEKYI